MAKELIIHELLESGSTQEVGRLKGQKLTLGREAPSDIVIARQGISRDHGLFLQGKNSWMYCDAGSTNGSWVNGVKLEPAHWRVVRGGDAIQVADVMLKVVESVLAPGGQATSGIADLQPQSLVVLSDDQLVDEFPVPAVGNALVVGGANSDLAVEGATNDSPALVIQRKGESLVALVNLGSLPVNLNGLQVSGLQPLREGDHLRIGKYKIIVNDPRTAVRYVISDTRSSATDPDGKRIIKSLFGQVTENQAAPGIDSTTTLDSREIVDARRGYERHPALRNLGDDSEDSDSVSIEDSLVIILGIGLLGALIMLGAWWFLS